MQKQTTYQQLQGSVALSNFKQKLFNEINTFF